MFIGHLGLPGVFHLFIEAIANSLDEYRSGNCTEIYVDLNEKKNIIMIKDNGRGIPQKALETVLTRNHSGGKFDDKAYYNYSIGLNGIGLKLINALSDSTIVITKRDGYCFKQEFSKGKPTSELEKLEKTKETGTIVSFHPDIEILKEIDFDANTFLPFCEQLTFLNKNLKIVFHATKKNGKEINKVFQSKYGINDFLDKINPNKIKNLNSIQFSKKESEMEAEIVFTYQQGDSELIRSFINGGMETKEHGTHVTAFKMALTQVLNKYIQDKNLLPKKDKIEITGDDVREGLIAIVDVKHKNPEFTGQTKEKLSNTDIMGLIKKLLLKELPIYLDKNKNDSKIILDKIILSAKGRMAAKKAKASIIKQSENVLTGLNKISRFIPCSSRDKNLNELLLIEGKMPICSH